MNMKTRHGAVAVAVLLGLTTAWLQAKEQDMGAHEAESAAPGHELATFGGGCFWCTEAVLEQMTGVVSVTSGYTGGHIVNPTYAQVCEGDTGHAEAVRIEFDPALVTYEQLLDVFMQSHDPTQLNRQGNDVGEQYRSAIFYHSEDQKKIAENTIRQLTASGKYRKPIVTQLAPAGVFYVAEEYHQGYYQNNRSQPYCLFVIRPKLEKMGLKP